VRVRRQPIVAVPAALAVATLAAGCGGGVLSADLFEVKRTGTVPGAPLDLVVNDGGTARCNGKPPQPMSAPELLAARDLQRQVQPLLLRRAALPPGPAPVFTYTVRDQDGHLSFSDDSPGQPPALFRLALLSRQIARGACHLQR